MLFRWFVIVFSSHVPYFCINVFLRSCFQKRQRHLLSSGVNKRLVPGELGRTLRVGTDLISLISGSGNKGIRFPRNVRRGANLNLRTVFDKSRRSNPVWGDRETMRLHRGVRITKHVRGIGFASIPLRKDSYHLGNGPALPLRGRNIHPHYPFFSTPQF